MAALAEIMPPASAQVPATVPQTDIPETPTQNADLAQESIASPSQTAAALPEDVTLKPDQAVLAYLLQKGYLQPLPDNRFYPDTAISRAEFVTMLYRASGLNTPFVSEFAYFRDVPVGHWAYVPIESFRMRHFLQGDAQGFFHPEKVMTRLYAGVLLSKTFEASWLKLTPQEIESTLSVYASPNEPVPAWAKPDLARSVYAGFLVPVPRQPEVAGQGDFTLALEAPLTRMDAARMVYRRALIETDEDASRIQQYQWIPPGVRMEISPTSAISPVNLVVGQTVYFALVEALDVPTLALTLPRGTRVHGKIIEVSADKMQAKVQLDKVDLPSGEFYNVASDVLLRLEMNKNQQAFLVPGQRFQVQTRLPH